MSAAEVRLTPASTTSSVLFVRLQAGLVRENVSLPPAADCSPALDSGGGGGGGHLLQPGSPPGGAGSTDHALVAFIRDAAESFVARRVSLSDKSVLSLVPRLST